MLYFPHEEYIKQATCIKNVGGSQVKKSNTINSVFKLLSQTWWNLIPNTNTIQNEQQYFTDTCNHYQ